MCLRTTQSGAFFIFLEKKLAEKYFKTQYEGGGGGGEEVLTP